MICTVLVCLQYRLAQQKRKNLSLINFVKLCITKDGNEKIEPQENVHKFPEKQKRKKKKKRKKKIQEQTEVYNIYCICFMYIY